MDSLQQLRHQWERVAAAVLVALGALTLTLGWFGASDVGLTAEQVPYLISGGLGGLFLMSVGSALWLSADLRDEWVKLDAIEDAIRELPERLELGSDGRSLQARAHANGHVGADAGAATDGPSVRTSVAPDDEPRRRLRARAARSAAVRSEGTT